MVKIFENKLYLLVGSMPWWLLFSASDIHYHELLQKVVIAHIHHSLPDSLDPLQFVYYYNQSMADAIFLTLHSSLEHVDNKGSYVRLIFVDYCSTFDTIIPT